MIRRTLALAAVLCAAAPAAATAAETPPHVLVYSGTAGFHHISIDHANAVLARLSRLTGRYTAEFIDQPKQLTRDRLARADIVLWQNTTGAESPFTAAQEKAYESFVRCGGGHMGVHASADSYKDWPAWLELTGAFFKIHPLTPTSIYDDQTKDTEGWGEPEATILVKDQKSPITAPWRGKDSFTQHDEYYAWDRDPAENIADFHPVLAFGGFTDPVLNTTVGTAFYAPEQPLAWTGSFRHKNRLYYTNVGHSVITWDRIDYQDSLLAAIRWVSRMRPSATCLAAAGVA